MKGLLAGLPSFLNLSYDEGYVSNRIVLEKGVWGKPTDVAFYGIDLVSHQFLFSLVDSAPLRLADSDKTEVTCFLLPCLLIVKASFDRLNKRITFSLARNCSYDLLRTKVSHD